MKKFILFLKEVRAPFFTASIIPVLLGTVVAYRQFKNFNPLYFVLVLLGSVFFHAGANVANDYFDHKSGNDEANKEFVGPFTGGSRLIQNGLLTPREVQLEFIAFFAAGLLVFSFLAVKSGFPLILMGLIAVFSGYFYIAPPVFLVSRGIGELLVGLNFGPLLCCSAYYVQAGILTPVPFFASLPLALLVTAILYINEFPDYSADKLVGKNNLVVRLGRKKAVYGYAFLMVLVFAVTVAGVIYGAFPVYSLLLLVIIPLAFMSVNNLCNNYDNPEGLKISCVMTVMMHLAGGLLFTLGYLL